MKRPEGFDRRSATADPPTPRPARGAARAARAEERAAERTAQRPAERTAERPADRSAGPPHPVPSAAAGAGPSARPGRGENPAAGVPGALDDRAPRWRRRSPEHDPARTAALEERRARRALRRAAAERRRADRDEVRRFTRRSRHRRAAWIAVAAIAAVFAGSVALAVFSPLLALRTIEVTGAERVDPVAVRDALDGQLGTPLALLDQNRIEEELGGFPLIRSFVVETVPPDTLVVRIQERQPIAVVATAGGFDVIDPAGVVIESVAERPAGLALVQAGGRGTEGPAFEAMVEVLLSLPQQVAVQVDSITAATLDDVTLDLAGSDQRVLWGGAERSAQKALLLERLLALHGGSGPGQYDVSAERSGVFRQD